MKKVITLLVFIGTLASWFASSLQAKILYVDGVNGNNSVSYAGNNGWNSAWKDLVHALYWAQTNDEIWLNTGTYVPIQAGYTYADARAQSFWTHSNVKIYGGFSIASGATAFGQRNPAAYPVFLSGEIQNDGYAGNNSYTVIKTYYNNGFSVLDGVTVTGSYNTTLWGGGLNINNCSPIINNCIFSGNQAMRGAGILIDRTFTASCTPQITNCLFSTNNADWGAGIYNAGCQPNIDQCNFISNTAQIGAGIYNDEKLSTPSSSNITNCLFQGNTGKGAIFEYKNASQIIGCTFTGNIGGGIHSAYATGLITDCIFTGNTGTPTPSLYNFLYPSDYYTGESYGGGLCFNFCAYKVNSCTFTGNTASKGGAIAVNEAVENGYSYFYFLPTLNTTITNCLIKNNSFKAIYSHHTSLRVTNCTIIDNSGGGAEVFCQDAAKVTSFNNCIMYNNGGLDVRYQRIETENPVTNTITYITDGAPLVKNSLVSSIIWANTTNWVVNGGGNIVGVNPNFGPNFSLSQCSQAIDAGDYSLLETQFNAVDRIGSPRVFGPNVDMGCMERQAPKSSYHFYLPPVSVCQGDSAFIFNQWRKDTSATFNKHYTAVNGCDSLMSVVFTVLQTPRGDATYTNNCATTGTINISPVVGTSPFTVTLNGITQNNILAGNKASFNNLAAGSYTYSLTDANGCISNLDTATLITYNFNQSILYVDANAQGYANGLNWPNAFTNLQDALDAAACSNFTDIYVSEGTYVPTRNANGASTNTPLATFQLKNNLRITGGFSTTHGATTMATRNYTLYPTILSGDLQQDNILTNNAWLIFNNENPGLNNTAWLDGFIIKDAYNNNTGFGAAMFNAGCSPRIENCTFVNNHCIAPVDHAKGGAMYNGMTNGIASNPLIIQCKFLNNEASGTGNVFGGAVANYYSAPIFQHCVFDGNTANSNFNQAGGAIYSFQGLPITLDNCLVINNNASAICSDGNSMNINNCTITKNTAPIGFPGGFYCIGNGSFVANTIIYGNANASVNNISVNGSAPNYFYCDIEGSGAPANWNTALGINYGANKDENPRLSSTYQLGVCSPAINAGTPGYSSLTTDLNNNTRNYFGIDMGCYEKQSLPSYSGVVFVDANATGANTGLNWTDAFTDLQSAMDLTCYPVTEIWVSKGTYVPSKNPSGIIVSDPTACFRMRNNVTIYGGFSVADGAIVFPLRNVDAYPTILSGDIQRDGIVSNNVYNVINNYDNGLNLSAVLDGVIISDAYNTYPTGGAGITWGAGIINKSSSPLFRNCTIKNNINAAFSSAFGAGVYNKDCSPEFYNCKFIHNTTNGSFVSYGAGMANINSNVVVKQCLFDDNVGIGPNSVGGGLYNSGGSLSMENCLLVKNVGGAICVDNTSLNLKNSTLTQNTGTNQNAGGLYMLACNPVIINTLIYNNPGGSVTNVSAIPTFAYCDVEGSGAPSNWNVTFGVNYGANIDVDPLFNSSYKLTTCSPAINSGTAAFGLSTTDLSTNNRIEGGIVDMGCYEFNGVFPIGFVNIIYVDANATGAKTGLSWTDAFTSLQDALDITTCTNVQQIWVSKGTYYPSKNYFGARVNDASACFKMINNVSILGGFSTTDGATNLASRNYTLFTTILSGDLQQDGINGNNAWNVINNNQTGVNSSAVLDGFMITKAYNSVNGIGGGVINANTSPTFLNCIFYDNFAGGSFTARGAGMHNQQGAHPYLDNCSFSYNYTSAITDAFGSGMSNDNSTPLLGRCKFIGNICAAPNAAGGGVYCNGGSPITIDNCLFVDNNAAAIFSDGNNVVLNNVTITHNTPTPTSIAGGLCFQACNPSIYNSIIYDNTGGSVHVYSGIPTIAYSDVQGSGAPTNWNVSYGVNYGANIDLAPNWNTNYKPNTCSPTVNAGTAFFGISPKDLDGNPRLFGSAPDMGCYETSATVPTVINASICANTYYIVQEIPGAYYNLPGTYNVTLPGMAANGCDSLLTIHLTVKPTSSSTTTAQACGAYFWNGITYTTSGIKTFTTTNAVGCDSVATLNLTITTPLNLTANAVPSTICTASSANVLLSNTENDVVYTLLNTIDASPISLPQKGNGSSLTLTSNQLNTNTTISILAQRNANHALHFNGTNTYLQTNSGLQGSGGTWEAWVSKENWQDHHDDRLFSNGVNYGSFNSFYISLHPSAGFHFRYGSTGNSNNTYAASVASQNFAPNSWHHLAATWGTNASITTIKLFIDGNEVASSSTPLILSLSSNATTFIGGGGDPANPYFGSGKMDDVRLWNYARTANQIQASMNNCNLNTASGLVANWNFNYATGNSLVPDVSGGNHDATLHHVSTTDWVASGTNCTSCDFIFPQTISITTLPCTNTLNLRLFLQGYYVGSETMTNALANGGIGNSPTVVDSILVELHDAVFPYATVASAPSVLLTNGTMNTTFNATYTGNYYVVIKHRNSLETWSASPIALTAITNYDFTTSANQAYGGNQVEVSPNVWAFYSGDINQDLSIDAFDYLLQDPDVINGSSGYLTTDLTGDGFVDAFDYIILDANLIVGVGAIVP